MTTLQRLFCVLCLGLPSLIATAEPVDFNDIHSGQLVGLNIRYLIDTSTKLKFEQLPDASDSRWQKSEKEVVSHGYSPEALWIQLELINSTDQFDWFIEVAYPVLDNVDFYIQYVDRTDTYHLGDHVAFDVRPVNHRNFVIPIELHHDEAAIVTLRVASGTSLQVPLKLWSQSDFYSDQQSTMMWHGIYYGIMMVMFIYNFFLFLYVKDINYLLYVFFVAFTTLFYLSLSGFGYQFLWPLSVPWNEHSLPLFLGLAVSTESFFIRSFLNCKTKAPWAGKFFILSGWITAIIGLASALLPFRIPIFSLIILALPIHVFCLSLGLQQWLKGDRAAKLFTIAWFCTLMGAILLALNKLGVVDRNIVTENALQIGCAIQVILLSFALGEYLAQQQRKAKDEVLDYALKAEKERAKTHAATVLNAAITKAHNLAEQRSQDVSNLLNNSGQGFIAFGADTLVEQEFSRACTDFFNGPPAGQSAAELLFMPHDEANYVFFKHCINEALSEDDKFRRDMMLSLLPSQLSLNGRCLKAEYKPLESSRVMMVLTDISNEVNLQQKIDIEHQRLSMIVAAITDQSEVMQVVSAFRLFLNGCSSVNEKTIAQAELYRNIHTFKGLFNQFSFIQLPLALHDIEDQLSRQDPEYQLPVDALWRAFDEDMDVIVEKLGINFGESLSFVKVSAKILEEIKSQIAELVTTQNDASSRGKLTTLLQKFDLIYKVDLQHLFNPLLRGTYILARKLDKKIEIQFSGDKIVVKSKDYESLVYSLVHVFRNAVDHGIETPEQRELTGKHPTGTIDCNFFIAADELVLQIKDDGAGINVEKLKARLLSDEKLSLAELEQMSDQQVLQQVLEDTISMRDEVTEISGRGVGLAATKMEVSKLGGKIQISSTPGQGSMTEIRLPWELQTDVVTSIRLKPSCRITLLMNNLEKIACQYLREEVLITDIQCSTALKEEKQVNLLDTTSIVRVAGDINMLVALSFEQALLHRITRYFLYDGDQDAALNEDDCIDMACEAVNIIVGLCIPELSTEEGIPILFSPPTVLDEAKTIRHTKSSQFYVIELQTEFGRLDIHCIGQKELFDNHLNYI
jgi:two-component system chemotaxis sensor kinase CheA